jgi:hypothetical protein
VQYLLTGFSCSFSIHHEFLSDMVINHRFQKDPNISGSGLKFYEPSPMRIRTQFTLRKNKSIICNFPMKDSLDCVLFDPWCLDVMQVEWKTGCFHKNLRWSLNKLTIINAPSKRPLVLTISTIYIYIYIYMLVWTRNAITQIKVARFQKTWNKNYRIFLTRSFV